MSLAHPRFVGVSTAVALLLGLMATDARAAEPALFTFRDVAAETGLLPHLNRMQGHAAGWGDVDGDGWLDLYAASFAGNDYLTNRFFRNVKGKFQLDAQPALQLACRASGALFADLDNDGDADLYVSSMPQPKSKLAGCTLFRNDGGGKFTDISRDSGACPTEFGGRSAAALDSDGDGLLDLLVGEDPLPGYNGSPTKSARLFRNQGKLQFEDTSRVVGLPADVPGLGVAVADVNNDGWPDFFLASAQGGNRLYLTNGAGKFREAPTVARDFETQLPPGDRLHAICGICFGDVNRDGLLDMLVGQHYDRPWISPTPNRLYLNRGLKGGTPLYEEITAAAGLPSLPMKAPHVEIQDFDNDGWPDLYFSMVMFVPSTTPVPRPVVLKNLALRGGIPQFKTDALAANDFPTDADRQVKGTGEFFKKMIRDGKCLYTASGPSADFDNDGKLDLFLCSWWVDRPSLLLRNETPDGNWMQVQLRADSPINRSGIGSRVRLFSAGKLGDSAALLGMQEISSGFGYASAQAPCRHFGLGQATEVDLEITLPHGRGKLVERGVKANQRISLSYPQNR